MMIINLVSQCCIQANIFCLPRRLKDVFKTSSKTFRRLQEIFARCLRRQKKYHAEDVFKMSLRCLQHVFTKTNVCWGVA